MHLIHIGNHTYIHISKNESDIKGGIKNMPEDT